MKWIKHFENWINESLYWNTDDWYIEDDDTHGVEVKIDSNVIFTIQSNLLPGFYLDLPKEESPLYNKLLRINYEGDFYVDIVQTKDEWFFIEYLNTRDKSYGKTMFNSSYFKCDGLDGLLEFLKDEEIIG